MTRSWLFVPGNSEKKLAKSVDTQADAVILDLEDSVVPENKAFARECIAAFLSGRSDQERQRWWVRINPLTHPEVNLDLEAVMPGKPEGIVLPKAGSLADFERLARYIREFETRYGLAIGSTRILPLTTETPGSIFSLGEYQRAGPRLAGLTWGAEDLCTAIGARCNQFEDGHWTQPFELARSLCLFAAHAAGVEAIDTVFRDFRNPNGLQASCEKARSDGFSGKLAIHPAQVDVINEAFAPSREELEHAQQLIALFEANPGAGTLSLNGLMVDIPHLKQARKLLSMKKTDEN